MWPCFNYSQTCTNSTRTDISIQKHAEEHAVERANLVEKLALRTQEAAQHEKNFRQMAELAPCGGFSMKWRSLMG